MTLRHLVVKILILHGARLFVLPQPISDARILDLVARNARCLPATS